MRRRKRRKKTRVCGGAEGRGRRSGELVTVTT